METVEAGWNRLVGASADGIAQGLQAVAAGRFPASTTRPDLYGDGQAGECIASLLAEACA